MAVYDIAVIGGGPAGLTAALYGLRAGKRVLVIEKSAFGGQITLSPKVENFPAVGPVAGIEFADRLVAQVLELGADTEFGEAVRIENANGNKLVHTASGAVFTAKTVIIACGAKPKRLGLPDEERLTGFGVSYCAVCDGAFFKGQPVAVVGGGDSALQEALFLSEICSSVSVIHRRDSFRAEERLVNALKARSNTELLLNSRVTALSGGDSLKSVTLTDNDGKERLLTVKGLFIAIGHEPDSAPFRGTVALDEKGYVDAAEDCLTDAPGVFTAGDCRRKSVRQLTTAVGDGSVAALAAAAYADSL